MTAEFTLSFEEPGAYVLCRYVGPFNAPNLVDAARRISTYCIQRHFGRVLIDLRASVGDLTVEDRYLVANNIRYQAPTSLRVAICIRPEQGDTRNTWTTVMSAHGFDTRAFLDLPSAVRWLIGRAG